VHAAHRRGVIHCDLKSSNILIDGDGHPRIVDFGLARALDRREGEPALSVTGQFVGSLPRASPEHAAGVPEAIDVRSDVYSLGVVLCAALTGGFPYIVEGAFAATLKAITKAMPQRPSARRKGVSRDFDAVTLTYLAKDPEARYASAAAIAICAFAGVAWWQSVVAERERDRAERERGRAERRFDEARELARVFLNNFHEAVLPLAGSRPAREKIVATALDYLTGLEAEVGDDAQFRADLAGAYERVADIQGNPAMPNLGQTDAAALRGVARAMNLIGMLEGQRGQTVEGLETLRRADLHLSRARAITPDDPALIDEGIAALDAVADRASVRDALDVLLSKRAFSLRRAGRLDESLATSERSVAINRELIAEAPDNAARKRSLSVSLNELATTQMALNRLDDAGRALDESIAIARSLREADRTSPTTIFDLAYSLAKAAQLERQRGATDAAIERFLEVHALRAEASALDPTNAVIRRGAAIALGMAAETAEAAAGDANAPTDRRAAHARRAIDLYRASGDMLRAMDRDGVLLKGDDAIIASFAEAIERLSAIAGASGTG
jgi:tetratricopeptide (TPR) repeat protein